MREMERADYERDERWFLFGLFLRHLRLEARLDIKQLAEAMAPAGCLILSDDLDAIERGVSVPRNPESFLRAVYASLQLDVPETHELARYLAFQLIAAEYRPETAYWLFFWS
jgi:hypothetical protein